MMTQAQTVELAEQLAIVQSDLDHRTRLLGSTRQFPGGSVKMGRIAFALLLTAPLVLALASCSGTPESTPASGTGSTNSSGAGTTATSGTSGATAGANAGSGGTGMSPAGAGASTGSVMATADSGGGVPPFNDGGNPDTGTGGGVVAGVATGMSAGCGKPPSGTDKPGSFAQRHIAVTGIAPTVKPATAGGSWTDRVYYLDLPTGYDPAKPYPLLFGGGGCGGNLITNGGDGGFAVLPANNKLAIQIGLSYVWPQGGGACFSDNGADTPDLPYFDAIMSEIEANYCIDKGKVFVGGYSSGGWESYMLGLARGGTVVRGISPAAGGLRMTRPPASNLPIAALLLTGGNDTANPATGPTGSDAAMAVILQTNGCVGMNTTPWPTCAGCGCVKYDGCPAAYPVIRCRPPGQGHTDGGGAFKTAIWSVWSTLP
jgi:poly(3-hydroxybutyrate) depolymerase